MFMDIFYIVLGIYQILMLLGVVVLHKQQTDIKSALLFVVFGIVFGVLYYMK